MFNANIVDSDAVQSYNRLVLSLKEANLDNDKIEKWKKGKDYSYIG